MTVANVAKDATDVILFFSQPRLWWARGGLCPDPLSAPSVMIGANKRLVVVLIEWSF
jgi:hypothetical protein